MSEISAAVGAEPPARASWLLCHILGSFAVTSTRHPSAGVPPAHHLRVRNKEENPRGLRFALYCEPQTSHAHGYRWSSGAQASPVQAHESSVMVVVELAAGGGRGVCAAKDVLQRRAGPHVTGERL